MYCHVAVIIASVRDPRSSLRGSFESFRTSGQFKLGTFDHDFVDFESFKSFKRFGYPGPDV